MNTDTIIPVIREELDVKKRTVDTGTVRVCKTVRTNEVVAEQPLIEEDIVIERVPVNRSAESIAPVRHEGDTTIIGVYEERLVVVKQLFLKEEIRLTRRKTEKRTTQSIELREEEVTITRAATGANNLKREGENAAAGSTPPESP